jgi:hypothetical protein
MKNRNEDRIGFFQKKIKIVLILGKVLLIILTDTIFILCKALWNRIFI